MQQSEAASPRWPDPALAAAGSSGCPRRTRTHPWSLLANDVQLTPPLKPTMLVTGEKKINKVFLDVLLEKWVRLLTDVFIKL